MNKGIPKKGLKVMSKTHIDKNKEKLAVFCEADVF